MSILNSECGEDLNNEWGQFIDIEDTTEGKTSLQNRFLSLFCFNNKQPSVPSQPKKKLNLSPQEEVREDALETSGDQSGIDTDASSGEEDEYDSGSEDSESDEESDADETIETIPKSLKPNNNRNIMKKLYRSVGMNKSKRSTVVLPENVLLQNLDNRQNDNFRKSSLGPPIQIVKEDETKTADETVCIKSEKVMLDVPTERENKISICISEAADILVALHPKASKDVNVAKKLKLQFEKADRAKQIQVVSRLPRNKLITMLAALRAQRS